MEAAAGRVTPVSGESPAPDASPEDATPDVPQGATVPVTLNQAIWSSLNEHPLISAGLQAIQQSQANYLTSTLLPNPQVFTDIQLLPLTRPFTVTRQGGPPQFDFMVTYPIDWFLFGKRAAEMASARAGVHASRQEFQDLIRQRVLETALAFYDVVEAHALLDVARADVKNLEELEETVARLVRSGDRPETALNAVRIELLTAKQTLHSAEASAAVADATLTSVSGFMSGTTGLRLEPQADLNGAVAQAPLSAEAAFGVATQARPDIQQARWEVAEAVSAVEVQERAAKPTIAPSVGYNRQFQEKAIGFPDANAWSASLNLSLPIFDRNQGNIQSARAALHEKQFLLNDALLELRKETAQAVAELEATGENARLVSEQLPLAESLLNATTRTYESGERSLVEVLEARRNYQQTYRGFITSRADYWRAAYRYYAAIGQQRPAEPPAAAPPATE